MSARLAALVRRRQHLTARVTQERETLRADMRLMRESATLTGMAVGAGVVIRRHPVPLMVLAGVLWWRRQYVYSVLRWAGAMAPTMRACGMFRLVRDIWRSGR